MSDPRSHPGPDDFGPEQIDHPGRTDDLQAQPDHGEDSYTGSELLTGRRAVITGADSGIGRAVAIAFAREGADICFTHLDDEADDAARTIELIRDAGRRAVAVVGDLRDRNHCRHVVDTAVDELGGIDIVVNNAAFQMSLESFSELTPEQLQRTFATNVFATVWMIQAALPHLAAGSCVINTTSIQATDPSPQLADYAATKAALVNLTQSLATEFSTSGIRVNAVAPGPIWTPLIPATMDSDKVESFGEETPLGRAGQPGEVAPAYVFLASEAARYITGETIAVTGGRLL